MSRWLGRYLYLTIRCYHQSSGRFSAVFSARSFMTMYRPVPRGPDFPAMERDMLRFWEENQIFDKLRRQTADGPRWSFLDGPITANNPMGVHHAWGRTYKDLYNRFWTMSGKKLSYQNGFAVQAL